MGGASLPRRSAGLLLAVGAFVGLLLAAHEADAGGVGGQVGVPAWTQCEALASGNAGQGGEPRIEKAPLSDTNPGSGLETQVVIPFVRAATANVQPYVPPSSLAEIRRFQCAFSFATRNTAGDLKKAASLLDDLFYDVVVYNDNTPSALTVLREWSCTDPRILSERPCAHKGAFPHGWGLYVIRRAWFFPYLAVEVPHPCAETDIQGGPVSCGDMAGIPGGDRRTDTMGVWSFDVEAKTPFHDAWRPKYLLVAGTRRTANLPSNAPTTNNGNTTSASQDFSCGSSSACSCLDFDTCADMAHQDFSIFEGVHETAVSPFLLGRAKVYQPHGFASASHPACRQAVVSGAASPTAANPTGLATILRDTLAGQPSVQYTGAVLAYTEPAWSSCNFGSARNNEQAVVTYKLADAWQEFLSVETSENVRNDDASRQLLSDTVAGIMAIP